MSFIKNKAGTIILRFTCYDGRMKYYTGEQDLDSSVIQKLKAGAERLAFECRIAEIPLTRELFKSSLDKLLNKRSRVTSDYFDRLTSVVDKMEEGRILKPDKKTYSKGSIKTFRFTIGLLKEFKKSLALETISMKDYNDFIQWCYKKDYSTNYIGSQIKNWKALSNHLGKNSILNSKEFKKISESTFDVYLTEEEISKLYKYKFSGPLRTAVDWFILGCYTGLRVSDLLRLHLKNLSKFITIANEKTGEKVVIPVHPLVRDVLTRRKGFPPPISDQKLNEYIKLAAEKAGFKEDVLFVITKGGKRQDFYMKKYQMISSHSGRRSFITNLRKNGVPDSIVMKLTGIKSPGTLKRYDLLSPDEAAKIASGLKFFK